MKPSAGLITECIKDFKEFGTLTLPLLMRRHKIDQESAKEIIEIISKRYPRLWKERDVNRKNN